MCRNVTESRICPVYASHTHTGTQIERCVRRLYMRRSTRRYVKECNAHRCILRNFSVDDTISSSDSRTRELRITRSVLRYTRFRGASPTTCISCLLLCACLTSCVASTHSLVTVGSVVSYVADRHGNRRKQRDVTYREYAKVIVNEPTGLYPQLSIQRVIIV